jgi:hypothetical protein
MAQTGTLNQHSYADLFDKTFDEIKATEDKVPIQGEKYFRNVMADNLTYKFGGIGTVLDLPTKSEDESELPFVQPHEHYSTTATLVNYRSAIKVEKTLLEIQRFPRVREMMAGLIKSYKRKIEYQFANIFNTGFTATGADAAALFADAHTHPDGSAGNWDNLTVAADITPDSYSTMRLNMRNRTNEKGFINPLKLTRLVCVADKERRAKEVLGSVQTADSDLNNEFAFHGEAQIDVWDWLTSTTAWFGWSEGMNDLENGLFHVERVKPEISDASGDPSVGVDIVFARRLRFANAVVAHILYAWDGNAGA